MLTLKDLAVDHNYYCSTNNFYSNDPGGVWDSWAEFWAEYHDAEPDSNLCFRWDLEKSEDFEDEPTPGTYVMQVFFIHQRKGIFAPHVIKGITEEDTPQILEFLERSAKELKSIWQPINF